LHAVVIASYTQACT